ncbi:RING finger and SPRY domain-containing protein 1 [Bicyclus anynana]|uniref:RING finger and SPRY domain-containing protein 1 n=1 Tax=Bicyclus anynana TaxID=110368 RepID=A0ABM3M6H2_BICAN|nr:RING finger and SPRY domain-containing protein 1 [Bicyclus anynana]XP_052746657.1 RING finger and SPRY domain-containing protein 1 [Bicyclus anynana]
MGVCCCKEKAPDELVALPSSARPPAEVVQDPPSRITKGVDPRLIESLIMEMLRVAATRVDTDDESPESLMKLHVIAERDDGWLQLVTCMVNVIPVDDPFGPTAISILLDECPLPARETVINVIEFYGLSEERACLGNGNPRVERNICITLGCIAEKLVGPNSVAVLTEDTLDYLVTYLSPQYESCIVLFALIALQKFSHTSENRLIIKSRLESIQEHPLLILETFANSNDYVWRQVGFCAQWALDNIFLIDGRVLSYETVDVTGIHAMLNSHDVSEYLQLSSNGLEARCDSYSFESVRCTFQVNDGIWYYEGVLVTSGVMQIGWATRNSRFLNDEGFGIGDDIYSISYDGCRRLVWYNARPLKVQKVPAWSPGDVLGCLLDTEAKEVIFYLNGQQIAMSKDIFNTTRQGFFAAASFMAYQQCRFNFGYEMFKYPPTDRRYTCFNDFGRLTVEEKQILPKRMYMAQIRNSTVQENICTICYDGIGCCMIEPCKHKGTCSVILS